MKLAIITLTLLLSACVSVPVERKFPSVPTEIQQPCTELQIINPQTTKLSVVVDSVVTNYGQYKECQIKVDSWIEWYNTQKKLFESVN